MAHKVDRCDIIDVLEEAAKTGIPVKVEVVGGTRFEDRVRDVQTSEGEDFAEFRDHGRIAVSQISDCTRGLPVSSSYDAKL